MLKRLYTLFIIIAMTASSTIKAEATGGTYELVTSADVSDLEDGGIYLLAEIYGKALYVMSTANSYNRMGSALVYEEETDLVNPPLSITLDNVNASGCAYEYILKKNSSKWEIYDINNNYIANTFNGTVSMGLVSTPGTTAKFTITHKAIESVSDNYKWKFENAGSGKISKAYIGTSVYGGEFSFACFEPLKYVKLYKKVASSPAPPSPTTVPFVMSAVGYATLYYGTKDVTLPEGLTANTYTLNETQDKTYLTPSHTYNAGDVIPAGVAVVVKGNAGDYNLTISDPAEEPVKYENVLKGYDTDTKLDVKANTCYYKLSINSEGDINSVGFYWGAENGGSFTTLAHKAYLEISTSQSAKQLVSILDPEGGNTTGMSEIKMQHKGDAEYDLGGMKTSKSVNGIKIKNGKKYFVIVK